ncbi:MAG: DUF2914 domain-containing protein, partial [Leptospiraceae bacterium]|nr:DUF2914 domain-containing protein [Leptospiraceae bacterium]
QNSSSRLKWILFHIILISFLILFTPLVIGKVNLLSVILGCIFYSIISLCLYSLIHKFSNDTSIAKNNILIPSSSVLVSFIICYTLQWIPPVPLTLEYIGIFHNIEKSNNIYKLTHFNSPWKFWNHGDQNFYFEESEKIYAFFRLKSPASISDKIQLHWFKSDSTFGWQSQDTIPISIQGGREEGYRGFGIKANYSVGQWRLQVETSDGREIGRIYFEVIKETNRNDRNTYIDYQ